MFENIAARTRILNNLLGKYSGLLSISEYDSFVHSVSLFPISFDIDSVHFGIKSIIIFLLLRRVLFL